MADQFSDYVRAGWKLCAITKGKKAPTYDGWQMPGQEIPEDAADGLDGAGLMHAYSGTCVIDVDDMLRAKPWLMERGVDIEALMAAPDAVRIESGRPHRTKLLYRLDKPMRTLGQKSPGMNGSGLEFRCSTAGMRTVQDVLPPTIHPDTNKPYRWVYSDDMIGHWSAPPPIPAAVLNLWRELTSYAPEEQLPDAQDPEREATSPDKLRQAMEILAKRKDVDSYEDWIDVGMRLHDETRGGNSGFDMWDQWSRGGSKYKGPEDLMPHWLSFGQNTMGPVKTLAPIIREIPADPSEFDEIILQPDAPPEPEPPEVTEKKKQTRKEAIAKLEGSLIYVAAVEKFFDLRRHEIIMTESGMQNMFQPWMPSDGRGGKLDPVKLLKLSQTKRIAQRFGFHPGEPVLFTEDGELTANAYQNKFPDPELLPDISEEDRDRIHWMFDRIADPVYRKWLMQFFAHVVQRPGVRIFSAPLIWSKTTGNGKSMLLEVVPKLLVGKRYSKSATATLLGHAHNDYMQNTWHLCLPEFKAATMTERGSVVEMLKDWITADSITVHPKGLKAYTMVARFFITATSNHPDAIRIENDERRWAIHQLLAAQMTRAERDYIFEQFLSTPRAAGVLRRFFLEFPLDGFDPQAPAPMTADRQEMIENSLGPEADAIQTAIEERTAPFDKDIVLTREATEYVQKTVRNTNARRVGRLLVDQFGGEAKQWRAGKAIYRGVIIANHAKWGMANGQMISAHLTGDDVDLTA